MCNDFGFSAVAVLSDIKQHRIRGGGTVFILCDVVVFAAPEENDAVSFLLQAAGLAQVGEQRALLSSPFLNDAMNLAILVSEHISELFSKNSHIILFY